MSFGKAKPFRKAGGEAAGQFRLAQAQYGLSPGVIRAYGDSLADFGAPIAVQAKCPSIFSFTRPSANSAATRMAFLMALAFDPPWQMMHTPRTPSRGAPPYSE